MENGAKLIQILRLHNHKIKTKRSVSLLFERTFSPPLQPDHHLTPPFSRDKMSVFNQFMGCMQLPDECCDCLVTTFGPAK